MRLASFQTGLFVLVTTTAAACGGGSDDRLLSSLSDADFVSLCEDVDSGLSAGEIAGLVGFSCILSESFAQDGCMQPRLDTCIDDGVAAWTGLECTAPDADDPIRTCDATVDELVACFEAQYASYATLGDAVCADLENFSPEIAAACAPVQEKCPDFFGSEDA